MEALQPDPDTARAIHRLEQMIADLRRHYESPSPKYRERFLVTDNKRSVVVPVADIDWIEASGNYVRLHVARRSLALHEPLTAVAESLDPHQFVRIHRSALVNVERVKETEPWFSGSAIVVLTTGERLRLSRSYRQAFANMFGPIRRVR